MTRHQPEPEPQRHPEPADSRGPASPAEAAPAPDPDLPAGAAVEAEGIGLKGPRGWVFREVTVEAAPGSVVALTGASGTGRTCLLLALTGRMKLTEGEARIGGLRLRKQAAAVRRTAALAHVPGVDDLEPSSPSASTCASGCCSSAGTGRRRSPRSRRRCARPGSGARTPAGSTTRRWKQPGWTWRRCRRGRGRPYGTWNAWSGCGSAWRWR
ncbi:ABC transporter ATP-binding protein [Actinomadura keratinilytica]